MSHRREPLMMWRVDVTRARTMWWVDVTKAGTTDDVAGRCYEGGDASFFMSLRHKVSRRRLFNSLYTHAL
jgi:hypothetical protein